MRRAPIKKNVVSGFFQKAPQSTVRKLHAITHRLRERIGYHIRFLFVGYPFRRAIGEGRVTARTVFALRKADGNPILLPSLVNRWESSAVFNSAVLYINNRFHFIYRAIGESGLSVFGYASSYDGIHMRDRSCEPVFVCDDITSPANIGAPFPYSSGGSWWGAEDPRLSLVGDTIFMTYTAFDGCSPPCVALTSISKSDFLEKKWDWKKSRIISQPGVTNKNWVLFPEKIRGKYALLHSISPEVSIDYRDQMDFPGSCYVSSCYYSSGRDKHWDNWVRGAGPPPIRTKEGWLLFYHAMDRNDPGKYKIGAMLLDESMPEKVLRRSESPLIEPDKWYENEGYKRGVVYSCGAVVVNNKVYVYYGGSDSFLCVSVAELDQLLEHLKTPQADNRLFKPVNLKNNASLRAS